MDSSWQKALLSFVLPREDITEYKASIIHGKCGEDYFLRVFSINFKTILLQYV